MEIGALVLSLGLGSTILAQPLALHPQNPHYFLFRGKPAVLVTAGEHYGAVLNLDFDYVRYLDTLKSDRLNLTRTFTGVYREAPGTFGITGNTLAPAPGKFICPWPRSESPGASDGGNKFNLGRWDSRYFARLRDFVTQAGRRGIVVELSLFCPYYREELWALSPLHARNNINGVGDVKRAEALSLSDSKLLAVEDAMVRRIVDELRQFDNLYYEICNEPYAGKLTPEWQAHIAATIRDADGGAHLIGQNVSNGSIKIEAPNPAVSVFNFHYSRPPQSVAMNYALNRPIGNNETGFDGTGDAAYRIQGWDFMLAGGALYNMLDFSFTAGHENGGFVNPPTQPGGGSPALRKQLRILREFLEGLDFIHMAPAPVVTVIAPGGASARALVQPGKVYAVYVHPGSDTRPVRSLRSGPRYRVETGPHQTRLALELPAGFYAARWVNTRTGATLRRESFKHAGGGREIVSPPYTEDIALRLDRK